MTVWLTPEEIEARKTWLDHSWDFIESTIFQLSPFDILCITLTIIAIVFAPILYKRLKGNLKQ